MSRDLWVSGLSSELFWDVLQEEVDPGRHERWLIERVSPELLNLLKAIMLNRNLTLCF